MGKKESEDLMVKLNRKFDQIFAFIWFLLAMFFLTGLVFSSQKEKAIGGMIIVAIGWILNEIIKDGFCAIRSIFFSKTDAENDNNKEQ